MEPLKPLPPLPSLWAEKRRKRVLGWATAVAVVCAIGVGVLHGVGNKIFDAGWSYIRGEPRANR
jgi:hypothetical protein